MNLENREHEWDQALAVVASQPVKLTKHQEIIRLGGWIRASVKSGQAFYKRGELYKAVIYTRQAREMLREYERQVKALLAEGIDD